MRANESAAEPASAREFVISREFDAPARLLFKAWSTREHIMKWFGPIGWPVTMCEMDFRVGGRWRMAMTGPDGHRNTPFGGTYLEIVPDRKIAFDNAFEAPGAETMIMTITFDEKGGKTLLVHRTLFASAEMKRSYLGAGFEAGTSSGFDQLAQLLAAMQRD